MIIIIEEQLIEHNKSLGTLERSLILRHFIFSREMENEKRSVLTLSYLCLLCYTNKRGKPL